MKVFGTIEKKNYSIDKYNAYAQIEWRFVSSSQGVIVTYPTRSAELGGTVVINRARKEVEYDIINPDSGYYEHSVYASVKHLFYNNKSTFYSASLAVTKSIVDLNDNFYVISIGQNLYGDKVKPGSFEFQLDNISTLVTDDSYGNLFISSSGTGSYIGNLFYDKGIAVINMDTGSSTTPSTSSFAVTNSGFSAYTFTGDATGTNPTLTLIRGRYYEFTINAPSHPFWIQIVSGGYSSGNVYSTGVTNNGTSSGTIKFLVPLSAPNTLYYYCQYHSSMGGTINVQDEPPESATVNFNGIKIVSGSDITLNYKSNIELEQHNIAIKLNPTEFNFSPFNSTIKYLLTVTGSASESLMEVPRVGQDTWALYNIMGAGIIKPYVTTIGLYNDEYQLLAIAKVSVPIQRTFDTEQIFIIKFDLDYTIGD